MDNLTTANRAIGIDIGSHSVKVVSLQQRLGTTSIEKSAEVLIRRDEDGSISPDAVVEALRKAMEGIRIRKDIVVVGIPTQVAAVRRLPIPFSDIGKARAVIKFQAEPHLPFTIDEVVIDFFDTKTGSEERMDVLLTAIRKQVLREQLGLVREIAIDPEVLEVDFMAICNSVSKCGESSEDGLLVMDIGCSKTIVAFMKNGVPLALRAFPIGGDAITNAIAKKMGVTFEEAERLKLAQGNALGDPDDPQNGPVNQAVKSVLDRFSGEVGRTLRSFTTQLGESYQYRAVLTGGGAMLDGMAEFASETLAHEVTTLDQIEALRNNTNSQLPTARFATAIGLGLRGLGEASFLQNFRQEELAYSQTYKRMRTSIYTSLFLLAAVFVAYVAGIVVWGQVLNGKSIRVGSKVREVLISTLDDVPQTKDPARLVEALREEVTKKRNELKDLRGTQLISVLDVLKELSTLIPEEMEIELKKFDINDTDAGAILLFEGTAMTNEDVDQIEDLLNKSDAFVDVKSEGRRAVRGRYSFKFKAKIREK